MSDILEQLAEVLEERKDGDPTTSYVASLYAAGREAILAKVAEESAETIEAARSEDAEMLVRETADLWFHTLVMLAQADLGPAAVLAELQNRFGLSGIEEKSNREAK